jgi:hypothetical protein
MMKQNLKELDEAVRRVNSCLLVVAIGLAALDLTVACIVKVSVIEATSIGWTDRTANRPPPLPPTPGIEALPDLAN